MVSVMAQPAVCWRNRPTDVQVTLSDSARTQGVRQLMPTVRARLSHGDSLGKGRGMNNDLIGPSWSTYGDTKSDHDPSTALGDDRPPHRVVRKVLQLAFAAAYSWFGFV